MGAAPFFTISRGTTPQEAFDAAVADARENYGLRGYTGTIAEKCSFLLVQINEEQLAKWIADAVQELQDELDACRLKVAKDNSQARIAHLEAWMRNKDLLRQQALAALAQDLHRRDPRALDAAGPALCLEFCRGEWLFFGYAT